MAGFTKVAEPSLVEGYEIDTEKLGNIFVSDDYRYERLLLLNLQVAKVPDLAKKTLEYLFGEASKDVEYEHSDKLWAVSWEDYKIALYAGKGADICIQADKRFVDAELAFKDCMDELYDTLAAAKAHCDPSCVLPPSLDV